MKLLESKYIDSQKLVEELNNTAFKYVDVKDINEEHLDHAADAYRYALDRKYGIYAGIDRGEHPDETAVRLEIPKPLLDLDIEKNIDRVLSRSELIEQMNKLAIKDEQERYIRELLNRLHKVKEVRDYIDNKIQKSMEYDWGRSSDRRDQMFTETVIELQLIVEKLDKILYGKKEFLTELENNVLNGSGETPKGLMQEFKK